MHYTELPDYPEWKDAIESLLKDGYPLKLCYKEQNYFKTQPGIHDLAKINKAEHKVRHVVGQKKGFVRVLGFQATNEITLKQRLLVCECDCGNFCLIKYRTFDMDRAILACSECVIKMDSFSQAFAQRYNKNINNQALSSIFGSQHVPLTKLINSDAQERMYTDALSKFTLDELKGLTNQYNAFSIEIFKLTPDKNSLYSPRHLGVSDKIIANCMVKRPEIIDLKEVPQRLHNRNLSQMIGTKINRYEVIGVLKTEKGYSDFHQKRAFFVLRCDCGMYSLHRFEPLHQKTIFCCKRCELIETEVRRREIKTTQTQLNSKQVWEMLGFKVNEKSILHSSVQTDLRNAYQFERKRFEHHEVAEKFKRFFGQRFGFVTVTDKARRNDKGERFLVAKCDCGNECLFEYLNFTNPSENRVLACSQCSYEINAILKSESKAKIACGSRKKFDQAWHFYLSFFNYPKHLEFEPIWKAYLILQKKQPELAFKKVVNRLIEALIKRENTSISENAQLKQTAV